MGFVFTLLMLGLTIFIHEYGHYLLMRRNGVDVIEFTVGFGPTLWERKLRSGTVFRFKPIFLGGYALPKAEGERSMASVSRWARFKIYMAGMFFNATAAFIVLVPLFYVGGGSPPSFEPYINVIGAPDWLRPLVGAAIVSYGFWLASPVIIFKMLFGGIGGFFSAASGPVGIFSLGTSMMDTGMTAPALLLSVAVFFVAINVGVAGFNLLPFMPLDGGHVVHIVLSRFSSRVANVYRTASSALMLLFIIAIIASDVVKLGIRFLQ